VSAAAVLDTSALLALLIGEPGAARIERAVGAGAAVSTLTVQEAVSKLVERGMPEADAAAAVKGAGVAAHDLTVSLAVAAGGMFPKTRHHGISHGDRACLALGRALGVPVLTADKAWSAVAEDLEVVVEQFR
jgi:PIN domain nuclease of toxin-antitoxin system